MESPLEYFWQNAAELLGDSERACVMLCGAKLEGMVGRLLDQHLHSCSKASNQTDAEIKDNLKSLTGLDKPLGSVVSQIRALQAMGVINAKTAEALRKVANTRNTFAHQEHPAPLDANAIKSIREMISVDLRKELPPRHFMPKPSPGARQTSEARLLLVEVSMLLSVVLHRTGIDLSDGSAKPT